MWYRVGVFLAGLLTVAQPDATAQDSPRRVTMDEAIALFASNNLELQIARARGASISGTARQAAAYPNPVLSISHESVERGAAGYRESYFYATQRLEWPWLAAARGAAAGHRAEAEAARVTADSVGLVFEVRRAFGDAAAAEAASTALGEAAELVRHAERQAGERAAAGDISRYELRRLRVERIRYESELAAATLARSAARRRLARLVLPDTGGELAPSAPLDGRPPRISLAAALARAAARHPDLTEAAALAASARDARRAASGDRLPSPTLTGGYKKQSDGGRGLFLGAGLSLPLFDRRGAATAAARAEADGATARLTLAVRATAQDVRRTHETYETALALNGLMGDRAITEADALLRIARVAYEEGEMNLVELLDAVDAYRASRAAAVEASVNLWTSYFDLERAVGSSLVGLPPEGGQ